MSAPFHGKAFTFTQPDGTPLQVRGWGDEHNARFETLDGFPVIQNPETGFYEYAAINREGTEVRASGARAGIDDPRERGLRPGLPSSRAAAQARAQVSSGLPRGTMRWEERRRRARTALRAAMMAAPGLAPAPPQMQTVGDYVGLCVLVEFPDVPATIAREEVEAFCNQPGYSGFGNNGSVHDYFRENSLGRLRYTNVVAPYYRAQHPRDYYTDPQVAYTVRTRELILEALTYLRGQGFDFSQLTTDNEGYVYALNVYYAGPVVNRWSEGLWPHAYNLAAPFPLMAGKLANDYQITDMGNELTLGTFCHENGHMVCNFPDLYDYDSDSQGVGVYCLMCAGGAFPGADRNPTHVCAYLKRAAGWAESVRPLADGMTETAVAGRNQFFIHAKNGREYFIIENRNPQGRDEHLTDSGLAIWHVDHLGNNSHQQGTPTRHYECALMQADGRRDLERNEDIGDAGDLYHEGANPQFGDTTRPNSRWWDGSPSGLEIRNIGPAGRETTFSVRIR
jgi:M6 family metalloprotease-like protein